MYQYNLSILSLSLSISLSVSASLAHSRFQLQIIVMLYASFLPLVLSTPCSIASSAFIKRKFPHMSLVQGFFPVKEQSLHKRRTVFYYIQLIYHCFSIR